MYILKHTDKILKEVSQTFDFREPPFDPVEFAQQLVKTMYDNNGICLAAIQVGIPYRVFAMRGSPENFVCFNPRVVQPSEQMIRLEETSLTYPGLCVKVNRPQHCRVRFATPNGEVRTETFTGMTARVFQQSMDFLDGRLFYSAANPIHRQQALRKWKNNGNF
jgi:peptide deformylase